MNRFALNFICKNESHIILRMLEAVRPVTDLIVALDTGSTDDTIALIQSFGGQHRIPTFVFERPFDNFGNSRNYALDMLRSTVKDLKWNPESTFGFRMDCDEKLEFPEDFDPQSMEHDLYNAYLYYKGYKKDIESSRQLFFRLSGNFAWEGPVHEYLEYDRQKFTTAEIKGLKIIREPVGATWKTDQEQKYLYWAAQLKAFVEAGNRSFRWVNHLAGTYTEAANESKSKENRLKHLAQAQIYFQEIVDLDLGTRPERHEVFKKLARNGSYLGTHPSEIREAYLQAYRMDRIQADPISAVIQNYMRSSQWQIAYLYSSFAIETYQDKKPDDPGLAYLDDDLYGWKLLYHHCIICVNAGRLREGRSSLARLKLVLKDKLPGFPEKDRIGIQRSLIELGVQIKMKALKSFVVNSLT